MGTALAKRVRDYLQQTGTSVCALERRAGLKASAVRNILHGRSKTPQHATVQALARAMGLPLEALTGNTPSHSEDRKTITPVARPDLLRTSLRLLLQECERHALTLTPDESFTLLKDIYIYALKTTPPKVDRVFVSWRVCQFIESQGR